MKQHLIRKLYILKSYEEVVLCHDEDHGTLFLSIIVSFKGGLSASISVYEEGEFVKV